VVSLHGHIHESGGRFRIGRTQTFNPGSEYVQGVLQGVIVSRVDPTGAAYQALRRHYVIMEINRRPTRTAPPPSTRSVLPSRSQSTRQGTL
jgi:hypothetical protein